MIRLQVDPELRGGSKRAGEEPSSLRCHASLPPYELVDPLNGNPQVLREGNLSQP